MRDIGVANRNIGIKGRRHEGVNILIVQRQLIKLVVGRYANRRPPAIAAELKVSKLADRN